MSAVFQMAREGRRPLSVKLDHDATLGRGPEAGLRISSRLVSREHCRVNLTGAGVTVRDLGSRNGTAVDGEAVGPEAVAVPVGSTLSVGGVEFRLVRCGDAVVPKQPVPEFADEPAEVPPSLVPAEAADEGEGELAFLDDDDEAPGDDASGINPLSVLPGGDARDQSSFAGFGEPENAVDSGLLDFLGGDR